MKKQLSAIIFTTSLGLIGCASTTRTDDYTQFTNDSQQTEISHFSVAIKSKKQIDFRGIYNPNNTIQGANILYYGFGGSGLGFAASVLTQIFIHEEVNNTAQKAKLKEQQQEANLVLDPIKDKLDSLTSNMLQHSSEHYNFTEASSGTYLLTSAPIFFFSQDLTTLSLKNIVSLNLATPTSETNTKKKKAQRKAIYENLIEVHHTHFPAANSAEHINNLDDAELQTIVRNLYEQSLNLALADVNNMGVKNSKEQSFKIYNGTTLQLERGTLFKQDCNKHILRNLRGWIIAYPKSQDEIALQTTQCNIQENTTDNS